MQLSQSVATFTLQISGFGESATNFVIDFRTAAFVAVPPVELSVRSTVYGDNALQVKNAFAAIRAAELRIVVIAMLPLDVVKLFSTIDELGIDTSAYVFVGSDWYNGR
jgi:hypothetical protein